MSDLGDLGLYLEDDQPMDNFNSGDNVFEDVLEEETHPLVSLVVLKLAEGLGTDIPNRRRMSDSRLRVLQ